MTNFPSPRFSFPIHFYIVWKWQDPRWQDETASACTTPCWWWQCRR